MTFVEAATVPRTFVGQGDRLRLPYPSYILYRSLAQIQGARSEEILFEPDWTLGDKFAAAGDRLRQRAPRALDLAIDTRGLSGVVEYNPGDLEVRSKFSRYQLAYSDALVKCSTPVAPWYVVPSDRKWYRNWVVARLLLEALRGLAPTYPEPS